jgi:2'-5' RNA ligase
VSDDWRDAYLHGTLVIWPPDDVRAVVNSLREHYDPASARICEAHITLTQPLFSAPDDRAFSVIEQITAVVQPFEIRYGGLDTFLPYPCLYLAIEPYEPLRALHDALQQTGLFQPVPAHHRRYVPHMTILEGSLDAESVARLADDLSAVAPAGSFACREVAYISPDESFRFAVRRWLRLGR